MSEWSLINALAVAAGLAAALGAALGWAALRLRPVPSDQFGGFVLSITIGVAGIALSLPLGIILALAQKANHDLLGDRMVVLPDAHGAIELAIASLDHP